MSKYEEWLITVDVSDPLEYGHVIVNKQPIVRCRDCVHAIERFPGDCMCDREHDESDWYLTVDPDGFCAWGERKEVDK